MISEIAGGQLWVNAKIRELAEGKEAPVQAFEWEDPAKRSRKDFAEGTIGIAIWTGADRKVIRFLESELADVERDTKAQDRVQALLGKALGILKLAVKDGFNLPR